MRRGTNAFVQCLSWGFGFLTTEPNAEVKAIHPKAHILTTPAEVDTWLTAPTMDALALQRGAPEGALKIVARGDRTGDSPGETRAALSSLPTRRALVR
jgi:putative SOS response-associated peptidase YedK